MMDKNDEGRRSHYLTLQFAIPDAPAADELVVVIGAATGGRPHHRISDRYKDLEELEILMSKTLQLSNNRIAHYFEQGEGEPLVLIHGVGMQAAAWYPQIEYFSKHYHVISVDMPGHGQSTKLPADAKLQDFVEWTIEFITALNLGPVNLAGHSMGSLNYYRRQCYRPDLVKRMAVLNGVYKRTPQARHAVIQKS